MTPLITTRKKRPKNNKAFGLSGIEHARKTQTVTDIPPGF
jgi:hypothetical protein